MTKSKKNLLLILTAIAVLLGIGLFVLYRSLEKEQPIQAADPTAVPTQSTAPEPSPAATPQPTWYAVVEIRIPVPEESPIPSTVPILDESAATPTPYEAYIYLPTSAPAATSVPSVPSGMAFTLSILGKTVNVAANVEEVTLEKTPGWLPTSAKPGEEGVCVVYGHRNRKHLSVLKDMEIGDEIVITMPTGETYPYIVETIEILESEQELRIPTIEGKHLILMTCYPFYYSGHAPKKFVVTAVFG